MPRQNRVTPTSELVAVSDRGTLLGNRGILHNDAGRIVRTWQVPRWLICVLDFNGRKRQLMAPNRYTELFFLDEATALAAGHRPCFECQRARFREFATAWATGHGGEIPTAGVIDCVLHQQRVGAEKSKQTFGAMIDDLPNGVVVMLPDDRRPFLIWDGHLWLWSASGYCERQPRPSGITVTVLTPTATVVAIRCGYQVGVHVSATG